MTDWNSKQYLRFADERTQPARDLVNRILIKDPKKILDVGCGSGNSTVILSESFPSAYIIGIDKSQNMLETAKKDYPELDFLLCDASIDLNTLGNDFDIVFSNACIQWIPNHYQLLNDMMRLLNKGGVLAVQTPLNHDDTFQEVLVKVCSSKKWVNKISSPWTSYNLDPYEYYNLLSELSSHFFMWQTTYYHIMKSHEEIIQWFMSTRLKPYFNILPDGDKSSFIKDVYSEVKRSYPLQKNGSIILKFSRLFFIAVS